MYGADYSRAIIVRPKQLTDVTGSFTEPVSLADMKAHLRVDFTDDDDLITAQITAARLHIEQELNVSMGVHQYRADLMCFADFIHLPRGPLVSVDKVQYYTSDSPEVLTTLKDSSTSPEVTSDIFSVNLGEGFIYRTYGSTWPVTGTRHDAVQITYTAGIAAPKANLVAALKLIVGDLYENRESSTLLKVEQLPTVKMLMQLEREWQ